MRRPSRAFGLLPLLLLLLLGAACKVNEADIEEWKGTIKGPGKMARVIASDNYPVELRARAGLALVEMERGDVEGVDELAHALGRLEAEPRAAIIDAMAESLESLMRGGAGTQAAADGGKPTELQARAKDAVFELIDLASPTTRQRFVASVIGWYAADFNGRNLAGRTSAEQVIRKLGPPAAEKLVDGINAKIPSAALIKLAQLISETGTAPTKKRAAERLVAVEREMESAPFLDWLKGKVREQAQAQGAKLDERRVATVAELNRENFIGGALGAIKYLAGDDGVQKRLLEIAASPSSTPGMDGRRQAALQALEGRAQEKHLDTLLRIALDAKNAVNVRDYAFDRVADIGSKRAIEPLWPLVTNGEDQRLRWRAGELVLTLGGREVLPEFFARLPGGATKYEPEELDGYATRMSDMTPAPRPVALEKLRSPSWWEKVIALRYLAKKGTKADLGAMKAVESDGAQVQGKAWKNFSWKTVGDVAKESVTDAEARLGAGQG